MDIRNVFVCPKCRFRLLDDLSCMICKTSYAKNAQVYNLFEEGITPEHFNGKDCTSDSTGTGSGCATGSGDDSRNPGPGCATGSGDNSQNPGTGRGPCSRAVAPVWTPSEASAQAFMDLDGLIVILGNDSSVLDDLTSHNKKIIKDILCVSETPDRFEPCKNNIHYLCTSSTNLALRNSCASAVIWNNHSQDPAQIKEALRILKPGCPFICQSDAKQSVEDLLKEADVKLVVV